MVFALQLLETHDESSCLSLFVVVRIGWLAGRWVAYIYMNDGPQGLRHDGGCVPHSHGVAVSNVYPPGGVDLSTAIARDVNT